jgi:hypothetical protein
MVDRDHLGRGLEQVHVQQLRILFPEKVRFEVRIPLGHHDAAVSHHLRQLL